MDRKSEKPLVTVAVLVYKNAQYLCDCLSSIFEQNYDNIQLIISDDGSPDFSCAQVEKFIRSSNAANIESYFVHTMENNGGTSKNFNYALSYAKGTYIKYIAADDLFFDENALGYLVTTAEENHGNVVIARAPNYDMYLNQHEWTYPSDKHWEMMKTGAKDPRYFFGIMSQYCLISAPATLFRTEFLRKHGGADEHYPLIEDWPLWMKMLRSGEMFTFLDRPVVIYRSGGISNGTANEKFAIHQIEYADVIRYECLPYPEAMANRAQYKRAVYSERSHRSRGELLLANSFWTKARVICRYPDVFLRIFLEKCYPLFWKGQKYKRELLLFSIITFTLLSITDISNLLWGCTWIENLLRTTGLALSSIAFIASILFYLLLLPIRFGKVLHGRAK